MILFSMPDIAGNWDNYPELEQERDERIRRRERLEKEVLERAGINDIDLKAEGYKIFFLGGDPLPGDHLYISCVSYYRGGSEAEPIGQFKDGYVEIRYNVGSPSQIDVAVKLRDRLTSAGVRVRETPSPFDVVSCLRDIRKRIDDLAHRVMPEK